MSPVELPEGQLNAGAVARLLGVRQQNVHKWLRARGLEPVAVAPHPVGRLYAEAAVIAARDEWLASRDREADEKRRVAALANAQERGE